MRVAVAGHATQVGPVINLSRLGLEFRGFFMAIAARNRYVSAGEYKPRFFMPGQAEGGRLVALEAMTAIAGIEVRSSRKLRTMLVGVTVSAMLELDLK